MNGMGSHALGGADWHRIESAKRYGRPLNAFIPMTAEEMISISHADLAIYCSKLQQIIIGTPGVDLSLLK